MWQQIDGDLYGHLSEVNCYALVSGHQAVLVEYSPQAHQDLHTLGVTEVLGVLLTHVHRDTGTVPAGLTVYVPEAEHRLFTQPEHLLGCRQRFNRYSVLQDDFIPLQGHEAHKLLDYESVHLLGDFQVLPTPGHTPGSVTLVLDHQGKRFAFVGDLLSRAGQVHDLSFTQWNYGGGEGLAGSVLSLLDLGNQNLDVLLPAHGEVMFDAAAALTLTRERLLKLILLRRHNPRLLELRETPFEHVTQHVLMNRTSFAQHYVVVSRSGKALFIDFGYDFLFGLTDLSERHARRPWLYNLPSLKDHGVTGIDAVVPTHIHDDHVAGINLLRRVHGARVLMPEQFSEVLEHPERFDLPCQWFDPILPDEVIGTELRWQEHTLKLVPFPGHTPHAVGILLDIDGERLLFGGDVLADDGLGLNYIYQNGFDPKDFLQVADTLEREKPTLLLSGHWNPVPITPEWLDQLKGRARQLFTLHQEISPSQESQHD